MSNPSPIAESSEPRVLSVAELTFQIKESLEGAFPGIWVSGEISNFSRPQSGHCYFTIKDDRAQLRAVMWKSAAERTRFELEDGMEVICQGDIEVYAPRGSYQLVVRRMEPKGLGALELALRRLREKLAAEGLFDPARKRPLPRFPRRVAFVTSPTGAAVRDFLEVMRRRWQATDVLVVPTRVQGAGAAEEIAAAIALVNRFPEPVDVLVVGRGGGSLEDLWCFNEEVVVRAIHSSRVPVVSAVGHEIDVTLSDLVADVRALTPSEAAERIVPLVDEIAAALRGCGQRMGNALANIARAARARLAVAAERRVLRRPFELIHDRAQRLDDLQSRASRAARSRMDAAEHRLARLATAIESLSPLAVLGRGYSLTEQIDGGGPLRDAATLAPGDRLRTRLARGQIISRVEQTLAPDEPTQSNGAPQP